MGTLAYIPRQIAAACCAAACVWPLGAQAQDGRDSSGEVVEIPLPQAQIIDPAGALTPSTDATRSVDDGRPRAELPLTSVDVPQPEHPVYRLRPEPFSEEGEVLVGLNDLLALAVDNNLGVRGVELQVEKGHYAVDQTYYAFDPSFGGSLSYFRSNRTLSQAAQQGGASSSEGIAASFDFTLPREYGDSFTAGYNVDRSQFSISGDPDPNEPVFGSGVTLGYNRPLLRGAGTYLNRIPRFIASNNLVLSYDQLDDRVRTLKKDVMDSYFLAVAARQTIDVRRASLERALAQLERAVERYKVGLGIQADVLQAENSVLVQRAQLLQAIEDYETLTDTLTQLVGLPIEFGLAIDAEGALLGLGDEDDPAASLPDDLWALVLTNSFDLRSISTQLANQRLTRDQLKNNLKPQLDLDLSYGRTGEDEGIGGAITGLENDSYNVGLTFRTTPGERVAKTQVAQNELDLASLELQILDTELQLKTRLRDLQRDLSVKAQQIDLAESNVAVTRQTLDIAIERANIGLATTLDVIEAQEDVLAAELALLQARVAYQQSYREILLLAGLI